MESYGVMASPAVTLDSVANREHGLVAPGSDDPGRPGEGIRGYGGAGGYFVRGYRPPAIVNIRLYL